MEFNVRQLIELLLSSGWKPEKVRASYGNVRKAILRGKTVKFLARGRKSDGR